MTDELAEAKRHLTAMVQWMDYMASFLPTTEDYRETVKSAQAFLSRLDAEGQTVEGGEDINELRNQISDLQQEDVRGDLGKRLSVLDAQAVVWHEISEDEPTEISAMVRVIRELIGYARILNRSKKRLTAELARLKAAQVEHDRTVREKALEEVDEIAAGHEQGLPTSEYSQGWSDAARDIREAICALINQTGEEGGI